MKIFKTLLTLVAFVSFTGMDAQKINEQVAEKVMVKNYSVDYGDTTIDYRIKIKNEESGYVTMEKTDLSKKEQDRVVNPVHVKKVISIDNDADPSYDNVLEVTYVTKEDDHFMIDETENGFIIKIVGNQLDYNFLKKEYNVTKKDADTFEVVVMKAK